jgi:hypothetical protein
MLLAQLLAVVESARLGQPSKESVLGRELSL